MAKLEFKSMLADIKLMFLTIISYYLCKVLNAVSRMQAVPNIHYYYCYYLISNQITALIMVYVFCKLYF